MAVNPGDIVRDKYRIDALIGRGGMGNVFAATELTTRAEVAIKVVSRVHIDDTLMLRLHREAEAAQRIRSDFVPRLLEVSETDEGETFLVMERLVGEPLSRRIKDNGALPWSEVRRIGEDILHGLIDAHTAGIIHRDLKPSNVFLARKETGIRAMLLDFGVCKIDERGAERLTGTGESIGTVAYMAPEQIRGAARVDERADLYAFGAVVFEMLSGRLPHEGANQMAILASKLERPAASLREAVRVAMPERAHDVVMRALHREPELRFGTAQELLKAWRALSALDRTSDPVLAIRPSRPEDEPLSSTGPPTEVSRPSSSRSLGNPPSVRSLPGLIESADDDPPPGPVAGELRMTQTSLTTQNGLAPKATGGRVAVILAAVGLVAGIGVAFVSFALGPRRTHEVRAGSTVVAVEPPVPSGTAAPSASAEPPTTAVESLPSAFPAADNVDPSEHTPSPPPTSPEAVTAASASGAPSIVPRPRSTGRPAAPKSSAPRITTQPRY